jgi:MerR family transcriptional regulator, mercuric resistance operon regulatory protein
MVRSQATTIAVFARQGGVGVETIRYYQRRGLLKTPPRAGGTGRGTGVRHYGAEDLRRLQFIRKAQAAGFTLEQIAELIALDATQGRARARTLAKERITALDAKISELVLAREALARLSMECASSKGACPILRAFDRD